MPTNPKSHPPPNDSIQGQQPVSDVPVRVTASNDSPQTAPNKPWYVTLYHRFKTPLEIAGAIIVLIGGITGTVIWIEDVINKSIDKKLTDEATLRKIAAMSRPIFVFDGAERIVEDGGAAQFIKELKITHAQGGGAEDTNLPGHVHIEFTKYFQNAPIVTPLSENTVSISVERGKGFSWEVDIYWGGELITGLGPERRLFRVEIMQ